MIPHAILVDPEEMSRAAVTALLEQEGFTVEPAAGLADARHRMKARAPSLIVVDPVLPDGNGLDLVRDVRDLSTTEAIVLSSEAGPEAQRLGAADTIPRPVDPAHMHRAVTRVLRTLRFRGEIGSLRDELRSLGHFGRLVGASQTMQKAYDLLARVAPTEATVLLTGESGTGKELAAMTIHELSTRREKPFLAINCGAVPSTMIESELFGHEKGSFTGAVQRHAGFFERASGGTLFLDEIAEMPLDLQVRLLRVLETGKLMRVGGERELPVDVRVVAATNRAPEQAVAEGKLREDLHYRLRVFHVNLPPLRDRGDDIRLLAEHFLRALNRDGGTWKTLSLAALHRIEAHSWPGNVRELRNTLQSAWIVADAVIGPEHLSFGTTMELPAPVVLGTTSTSRESSSSGPEVRMCVGSTLDEAERRFIMATYDHCGRNKTRAARVLGVSPKTLYNKMKEWGSAPAAPVPENSTAAR